MSEWKYGLSVSCRKWEYTSIVSGDPNQKLPQSWCLSGSLTSGPGLWQASAGSSKPGASSDDWFSELDCNQSDINCQFLQQLTSPNHLRHYGRWSLLTKRCKVGILNPWQYFLSTIWGGYTVLIERSVASLECEGSPLKSFQSKCPLRRACVPAVQYSYGGGVGVCVQDLAAWPGQWWCRWMGRFSVDLKLSGFSECLLIQHLRWYWHTVHFYSPRCVPANQPWSILDNGCRSRLPAP